MSKKDMFKFRDVDMTFNFKKLPSYDQEYLRTMVFEQVNSRSVKASGEPFNDYYPNAGNFALFSSKGHMSAYMSEFFGFSAHTASHLLHGKKYYFAWMYGEE